MQKKQIINKALIKLGQIKKATDIKFESQINEFGHGFHAKILELTKKEIITQLQKEDKNITSQNFSEKEFSFNKLESKISWHFEIEARDYGIKSFIISAPDQEILINLKEVEYATDEDTITLHDLPVKMHLKNIKITGIEDISLRNSVYPKELEFYQNKFELSFN